MKKYKAALLVIDAQRIYTDPKSELFCRGGKRTVGKINQLITKFKRTGDAIIFIRHEHKTNGSDLGRMFDFAGEAEDFNFKAGSDEVKYDESLIVPSGSRQIAKRRYSAFTGTNLHQMLKKLGVKHVYICGFMTNFCCESTAREAHDLDYFVTFVPDATGCPDLPGLSQEKIRKLVSAFLEAGFAVLKKTSDIVKQ